MRQDTISYSKMQHAKCDVINKCNTIITQVPSITICLHLNTNGRYSSTLECNFINKKLNFPIHQITQKLCSDQYLVLFRDVGPIMMSMNKRNKMCYEFSTSIPVYLIIILLH